MIINATGFVSCDAGSVASANAVILQNLLQRGDKVHFYTKPSFVDPRPVASCAANRENLTMVDCTNHFGDSVRRYLSPKGNGLWGRLWSSFDAKGYNRNLTRKMRESSTGEIDLWLGDWAKGRSDRPVVSFVQGPPGTDARSVFRHRALIERLAGKSCWLKLAIYASWRLGPGLPRFEKSDVIISGSEWSRNCMINTYDQHPNRNHALPYPVDLEMFRPSVETRSTNGPLRVAWLGRFAPRKRLDLFLKGLATAIQEGCDIDALIIGRSGFVPGYERLIEEFPYRNRLLHRTSIGRSEVPSMLNSVDVLAQPSDDENFGSSVAEALACGIPVIVGATNGTGQYACDRSIQLSDDKPSTLAEAFVKMAEAKKTGTLVDTAVSRKAAEDNFETEKVVRTLSSILESAILKHQHHA